MVTKQLLSATVQVGKYSWTAAPTTMTSSVLAVAATATVIGGTWYTSCQVASKTDASATDGENDFRVEVHLMDKIQQKSYLATAQDGIPSTLRILAIDLPEMRTRAFSGECRLAHDKIFVDDVASPKAISVGGGGENAREGSTATKATKLKVTQKALVKSLVQCRSGQSQQRVGVELLEASVSDLNKYQLRRTHQFGNFKYDPGKYFKGKGDQQRQQAEDQSDQGLSEADEEEILLDKAGFEEELEAPWNQYAWTEEMRLRINGQVGFDSPMEKATRFNSYLFGQAFKITIHSIYYFWEWPLPTFAKSDPNGIDGRKRTKCHAGNKPHAVIANGAALQKVPSSLRLLQKICKKADVPLFVIHDPRVWGGNTHQTLPEALQEMRNTIKGRVIQQALKQQGSTAFARGLMMGQLETELKWEVKEKKRISKEMFGVGKRVTRRPQEDWSQLETSRLERRLIDRGVIKEKTASDGEGDGQPERTYTDAMVEIAKRCVESLAANDAENESTSTPTSDSNVSDSKTSITSAQTTTNV